MATSPYFNNWRASREQELIEDLIVETIKIHGLDVYYIPKSYVNEDKIFGEDDQAEFNSAYMCDMYVKNVEGFAGDGDFLSKFNLQIRDNITFTVARRTFNNEIGQAAGLTRPREGDLIFFPLNGKVFQITFVEHEAIFYQLGDLQIWDLKCELFEYSGERLNTGISAIDSLEKQNSLSMSTYNILTANGYYITDADGYPIIQAGYDLDTQAADEFSDNDEIELEADEILVWNETNPFGEV